jgi:hypothetical protein
MKEKVERSTAMHKQFSAKKSRLGRHFNHSLSSGILGEMHNWKFQSSVEVNGSSPRRKAG